MSERMGRYNVVRFYRDHPTLRRRVILRGVSMEVAQKHCHDIETSSSTCTKASAKRRTRRVGAWFDGFEVAS